MRRAIKAHFNRETKLSFAVTSALFFSLLASGCGYNERHGDFDYRCERSMGIFDGWVCTAPLKEDLILLIEENGDGPIIHVEIDSGRSAQLIPPNGNEAVITVGYDNHILVAETSDGNWYFVRSGEQESPRVNWPLVHGPFTRAEVDVEIDATEFLSMRRTK